MVMRKITGDDGKATFELPYGDYTATIKKSGYATVNKQIAFRSNHKNFTEPLYVGGVATINVIGAYGGRDVPLENATVTATATNNVDTFTGTTNANGICYLEMPYSSRTFGSYEITVAKDGFTQDYIPDWEFYDDQNTCEVHMTSSVATVTINVVDGQGEPTSAQGGLILKADENINFEFEAENGTATISDVYYGTYLFGCGARDEAYYCEVIVDSETETVNATLQDPSYTLTINDEINGTSLFNVTSKDSFGDEGDIISFQDGVAEIQGLYGFYDYNIFTYNSQTIPNEHWVGGAKSILIDENKSISYDAIRNVTINFVDASGNPLDFDEAFDIGMDFEHNYCGGYASGGTGVVSVLDGTYKVKLDESASYECNATITIDATHTVFNIIATEKQTNNGGNDQQGDVAVGN